jgi:hypothetical protein
VLSAAVTSKTADPEPLDTVTAARVLVAPLVKAEVIELVVADVTGAKAVPAADAVNWMVAVLPVEADGIGPLGTYKVTLDGTFEKFN